VGGGPNGTGSISLSNQSPVLAVGQSQSITITGGSGNYYISSISNPSVVTLNLRRLAVEPHGDDGWQQHSQFMPNRNSSCATLTVTVNSTGSAGSTGGSVTFTTTGLPAGTVGQNYSYQLQAQGGAGSYTYFLPSGSLPSGLTLSTGGLIQGTPTIASTSNFTLEVSDSGGTAKIQISASPFGTAPSTTNSGVYANGELINENGTISIVYKGTKTPFANAPAFLGLGFKFSDVTAVSNSGLPLSGKIVVTADGGHPRGSWLLSGSTVYFLTPDGLIPIPSWAIFLNNGGQAGFPGQSQQL